MVSSIEGAQNATINGKELSTKQCKMSYLATKRERFSYTSHLTEICEPHHCSISLASLAAQNC